MLEFILKKIMGTKNERELKKLYPIVDKINSLENEIKALTNEQLKNKTVEFKQRIENGESLDSILPETFAVVREAAKRTLNMRHFDCQLIGGIVLHQGKIAEMKTGEGKTLVATLPAYLNALTGKGVHIVTVNDYLAKRDSEWMGTIYKFLGLTVGCIVHELDDEERKEAYNADITYGTNNEFGFDYLRDNMKFSLDDYVQREFNYAIVDEVDSILIDEARTPLIISGPSEESTELYYEIDKIIPYLKKDIDFTIDEKSRIVALTEEGITKVEKLLNINNLYDPRHVNILHHVNQALRAHHLFKRDVDYVVKDGEVIIVDEFTGRLMPGRRWSDGLHQAVEAKEKVKIEKENQTLATITFQNFFRMYKKLAGMTGTAETEAEEFKKIYNLDVVVIPTNKPMIRIDYPDVVYKTEKEKFKAVVEEIKKLYQIGRPVLVGTTSIEKNEKLSAILRKEGIPHQVLNAKHHEKEAEIIAQAGRLKTVTIATNMAGRGVDILLGGNPVLLAKAKVNYDISNPEYEKILEEYTKICEEERQKVIALGGLHIIGTERHESRRIDNQLRGRAGRQGDPGSSRFYLSLEDDLMRIFGSDRIASIMDKLGIKDGEAIEHNLVTKAIENAQKRVEAHNFEIRKHLLEYDDVMNKQREFVYSLRKKILMKDELKEITRDVIYEVLDWAFDESIGEKKKEWNVHGFIELMRNVFDIKMTQEEVEDFYPDDDKLYEHVEKLVFNSYEMKEKEYGEDLMKELEKYFLLTSLDSCWKEHLLNIDHLKEGIGLRGYAQKDPLVEYKKEAHFLFMEMLQNFRKDAVMKLFNVRIVQKEEVPDLEKERQKSKGLIFGGEVRREKVKRKNKVGRNDPCPCGSGKKYKKCCGAKE